MGSVKSLEVIKKPTTTLNGVGVHRYSDAYSVFDYGQMPQTIPDKGISLCLTSVYNFKQLLEQGIPSHLRRLVAPYNEMEILLARKLWSAAQNKPTHLYDSRNFIVPLEIIDRPYIGETSSARKRVNRGEMAWEGFGLDHAPEPTEKLSPTVIDFSTKYDDVDRYFNGQSFEERAEVVMKYARLTPERFERIVEMANAVSDFLTARANELGMVYLDGKIEVTVDSTGTVLLADEVGTLDSCRFMYKGIHLSKEFLREQYRGSEWHLQLQDAQEKGVSPKNYPQPPSLDGKYIQLAADIYRSACNAWTGEEHFLGAPTLDEVVDRYKEIV